MGGSPARQQIAEPGEPHTVGPLIFGPELHASTLEILDLSAVFLEYGGQRIAEGDNAAVFSEESEKIAADVLLCPLEVLQPRLRLGAALGKGGRRR